MKTCKIENCNNPVWTKEVCKNHMIKTSLKKKIINNVQNRQHLTEMREMFLSIWKKRPHKSEVSGDYLGNEPMSTYFHHILAKEKYPEACLDEENIVILSLLEHSNVENDMYKYPEVNKRREQLKIKYKLL
jgi:hypothetical protein